VVAEGAFVDIYLTAKKTDFESDRQIPRSIKANSGRIAFEFDDFDLMNGDYKFTLVGIQPDGSKTEWSLGTVSVWFKEGESELVNDGVLPEFRLASEIISEFPAADK
jgi:hypothetical protein